MQASKVLVALEQYKVELGAILGRFTRTREYISIDSQDNYQLRTITTELVDLLHDHVPGSAQHIRQIANSYNEGVSNFYNSSSYASVEEIRGVVSAVITRIERNPTLFTDAKGLIESGHDQRKLLDALDELVLRFHNVAVQLRNRHADRPTLDVNDEYDVQDLMHALLRLHINDVRPEEWVPSYAGSASRTDFLLPEIDTVIEIKKNAFRVERKKRW